MIGQAVGSTTVSMLRHLTRALVPIALATSACGQTCVERTFAIHETIPGEPIAIEFRGAVDDDQFLQAGYRGDVGPALIARACKMAIYEFPGAVAADDVPTPTHGGTFPDADDGTIPRVITSGNGGATRLEPPGEPVVWLHDPEDTPSTIHRTLVFVPCPEDGDGSHLGLRLEFAVRWWLDGDRSADPASVVRVQRAW